MMNLEESIRQVWDLHSELEEKIPKERVTAGSPGKGVIPYVTIEIDKCVPALLVNTGYLRETIHLHLGVRHDHYAEAREFVDLLQEIFKNTTIDDVDSSRYAQMSLSKTTIEQLKDRTWLLTVGMVADIYLPDETPE
jgi:hypothetical protein